MQDLRWAQRIRHQLPGIIGPWDDVDPLRPELADDTADADASGANTGAYGVDALLVGRDRNLAANAGLARQRANHDGARLQLGDLELEQAADQCLVRARDDHLGALGTLSLLEQQDLQVLPDPDRFLGDLL